MSGEDPASGQQDRPLGQNPSPDATTDGPQGGVEQGSDGSFPSATTGGPQGRIEQGVGGPSAGATPSGSRTTRRVAHARKAASLDDRKVRRAALSVGVAVAMTAGAITLIGCVVLIVLSTTNAIQFSQPPEAVMEHGRIIITQPRPKVGWLNADRFIWAVAILAFVSLIVTPLVAWWVARRATKPLSEALRLQRHFVADASHELRTPLTALSSRVQILQRRLAAGKPIEDIADQLRNDTTNITRILNDMLFTVEGTPLAEGTRSSVVESVRQATRSLVPLAQKNGVTITVEVEKDMKVAVPDTSLTRAIIAITDNAISHAPSGSSVDIAIRQVDRSARVTVTDHGTGIVGVKPDQVFDRFAHGAETGRKRSFGLGLALASEVAHRFGGDIRVADTSAQGTTFALSFPIA
ncbi:MAG: HAMP domain-containing histidine kinase [Propionibacteriaceae bacterium]|jgi:signal transduction histidine kinase|nr:HAMP domain-containing histidine kinase [Propionibacteriaceae bacterium]